MIEVWYVDKDGHYSAMGYVKTKKEARNIRNERILTGRDLHDNKAKSFI